ncbi:MAG TPA: oxidoreductase [Firmicutes bacterium]|nr:oxidoreductase [Bacillota bacterium]
MKIGFIGIGVMGLSMSTHLLNAGHELFVYNRTKSKADPVVEKGATWCESVAEVAKVSDVIFTIIGLPQDVEAVYFGDEGLLAHAKAESILIDMTTSTPDLAKRIYEAGSQKGISCLDAPVTGGDVGAKNGTLTIMVGGDEATFNHVLPLLDIMGKTIVYMGQAGNGQHTKMVNQIAIAGAALGMVEALSYANAFDLNPNTVLQAITSGSAASWQLSNMAPRIVAKDFNPGFYIKHFIKDMKIAAHESAEMDVSLPGLELVLGLYEECQQLDFENLGTQALYKLYEQKNQK